MCRAGVRACVCLSQAQQARPGSALDLPDPSLEAVDGDHFLVEGELKQLGGFGASIIQVAKI